MPKHWTLEDIAWSKFDPAQVDPELLKIVKAAALVEHNGGDYAVYLCNVFGDDAEFQEAARLWASEEIQHGKALARWATLADPSWSFDAAFKRFTEGYKLPLGATSSVRGSRTGELIARCIVETGTSSYYSALAEASAEPVLRQICLKIAGDEFRHYKLFYTHMKRYLDAEKLGFWGRLRVGFGRLAESEDDELAYAYYAASGATAPYDRRVYGRAYVARAYRCYRPWHIEKGIGMAMKAVGLKPGGTLHRAVSRGAGWFMRNRVAALARAGA